MMSHHGFRRDIVQFARGLRRMAEGGAALLRRPLAGLDTAIGAINANITRFVALANPGAVIQFQRAVNDLYAVIGQAMLPALQAMTRFLRDIGSAIYGTTAQGKQLIAALAAGTVGMIAFGAAMAAFEAIATGGVMPIIGALIGAFGGMAAVTGMLDPLMKELAPVLSGLMDQLGGVLEVVVGIVQGLLPKAGEWLKNVAGFLVYLGNALERMSPAIEAFVDVILEIGKAWQPVGELLLGIIIEAVVALAQAFKAVSPYLIEFIRIMAGIVKQVVEWIRQLLAMFGIVIPEFTKMAPKGAVKPTAGAAVERVQTTDIESVLRSARERAFQIGGAAGPPEQTAKNTSQIVTEIQDFKRWAADDFSKGLSQWITKILPELMLAMLERVIGEILNLPEEIAKRIRRGVQAVGETPVPGAGGAQVQDVAPWLGQPGLIGWSLIKLAGASDRVDTGH